MTDEGNRRTVSGYNFEEETLIRMRERVNSAQGYVGGYDYRPDFLATLDALQLVLSIHSPEKGQHTDIVSCALDYDKPYPCETRQAIRTALLNVQNPTGRLSRDHTPNPLYD
jgi:hypothetical protein